MISSSSIIHKHIFKQLLLRTLLNTFILTGILLYGNLQKHGEVLIQSLSFSLLTLVELAVHLIPYSLSMGLPFGFALAILFCVGRWSSDQEILSFRSHGLSISQWSMPVFLLSFLLSLFSVYASVDWSPLNRAKFDDLKKEILWSNLNALLQKRGQIDFNVNSTKQNSSFSEFASVSKGQLSRLSISVSETQTGVWKNARMVMTDQDGVILSVLHAGKALVSRSQDRSNLILNLKEVDLEPGFDEENKSEEGSSMFLSFKSWKKPIVIELFDSHEEAERSFKKMGFRQKLDFLSSNPSNEKATEVTFLLHKGIALGCAPFFLSVFLLPVSAKQKRRETMINLLIGLSVCLAYFLVGSLGANFLSDSSFRFLAWWFPNILCFLFGYYLIQKFEN